MTNHTTYIARGACLVVGTALAGVGMYASYMAATKVGNEYLMVAAPLVALAAPVTMVFVEIAVEARQYVKAMALLAVFILTAATVFYTAAERNHDGRAVGEAQRLASRTAADRAERELNAAKAARIEATAKADKVRGIPDAKCKNTCLSLKASEQAATQRVVAAEQAVRDAAGHAVTDSDIQQADWLMPLSIDVANMVFIWCGFGLGRIERKPMQVVTAAVEAPALTKRQIAARKGVETKRKNLRLRVKARTVGPKLAAVR